MKTKSHSISGAFVFMLLGVFAVFSMLLVVLGAQAYRTTVDGAAAHTQKRIVTAFVRNAVRAQDERGAITVEEHDGLPVLALSSELDGERYVQYIYSYGGSLANCLPRRDMVFRRRTARRFAPRSVLNRRLKAIC